MSQEILKPNSITSSSNMDPSGSISDIIDDPTQGVGNGSAITSNDANFTWNIRISLNNPTGPPSGDLVLRAYISTPNNITTAFAIYQNGTQISPLFSKPVAGYNEYILSKSYLIDNSGQNLEIVFNGGKDGSGVMASSLYAVDIVVPVVSTTVTPDVPTNLSPANNYMVNGQFVNFSAILNDGETAFTDTVSLVVEYSKDSTFATGVITVVSSSVSASSTANVNSNYLTDGTYYWRAFSRDSGNLESAYTSIRTFIVTNNSIPTVTTRTPANNTIVTSASQTISAIARDANGYNVKLDFQVSADLSFTSPTTYSTTTSTSGSTLSKTIIFSVGNNYWRVRAVNEYGVVSSWSSPYGLYVNTTVTGRLSPDSVLAQTNLTGATVANLSDDPDTPDSTFATATSNTSAMNIRVSFPSPPSVLKSGAGLQVFNAYVKRSFSGATTNPTVTISVYENGVSKAVGTATAVSTSTGMLVTFAWDSSVLTATSGANVEFFMSGTMTGSGGSRTTVSVGAIEWNYTTLTPTQSLAPDDTAVPSGVANLSATTTDNSATLTWNNPSNSDFSHVEIYRDNVLIKNYYNSNTYTDYNLTSNTSYSYKIIAVDFAGSKSTQNTYTALTQSAQSQVPSVTIISVSVSKISDEVSKDRCTVTFSFDTNVTAWEVRVMGTGHGTGTLADSGGSVTSGTQIQAVIDWAELYQEGDNRINIYGQNATGWTSYES